MSAEEKQSCAHFFFSYGLSSDATNLGLKTASATRMTASDRMAFAEKLAGLVEKHCTVQRADLARLLYDANMVGAARTLGYTLASRMPAFVPPSQGARVLKSAGALSDGRA